MRDTKKPIPLVEADSVSFAYKTGDPVLNEVSFKVERGDFFGIIGPNGSGKSTLLRIMLGLEKPTTGTMRIFGEDPRTTHRRASIGYVAQTATHFEHSFPATVLEVVMMGRVARAGLFKRLNDDDRTHAMRALREVGMESYAARPIGALSTGQQQRVIIARALAGEPELLVMDEPTVGVDVNAEAEFYNLVRHLNEDRKITVVIVTHDIDIVGHEVNKLMCLHCSIATHGTPKQFLEGAALHTAAGKGIQLIPHHERAHHTHTHND
jgi:zinc transport system ATP-binding protein